MIKHIFFPTDGSENAKGAFDYLKNLAVQNGAKVTVFFAYDVSIIGTTATLAGIDYSSLYDLEDKLKKYGEELVEDVKKQLEAENVTVETKIARGVPSEVTVAAIQESGCDLVVMGRRGLGGFKSFLLGSVSAHVIHHVKCPVLLIPATK